MELYIEIEMKTTDNSRSMKRIRAYSGMEEKMEKQRKGGRKA